MSDKSVTPTPPPTPPDKKEKQRDPIYVTIIILLLIGGSILFYEYNDARNTVIRCNAENEALNKEIAMLDEARLELGSATSEVFLEDLNKLMVNYDTLISISQNLKKDTSNLMDSLMAKRNRIQELEEEVKRGKWTAYQLREAKKELGVLRKVMQTYVRRIDSLTVQNAELNRRLNVAEEHITKQEETITQYETKTTQQEKQLSKGRILKASKMLAEGMRLRNNGDEKSNNSSRRANRVKTCFTVIENKIARPGVKTLYMRVIDPDGQVLTPEGNTFEAADGSSVKYSDKRDIDYQNKDIDACIYYIFENTPPPDGTYTVEIWAEGYKIGTTTFDLK